MAEWEFGSAHGQNLKKLKKNKPKADLETAQPTVARFKNYPAKSRGISSDT